MKSTLKLAITSALMELRESGPTLRDEAEAYCRRAEALFHAGDELLTHPGVTEVSLLPGLRLGDHIYLTRKACGLLPDNENT